MNSEKASRIKISQILEKHVKSGDMETVTLGTLTPVLGCVRLLLVSHRHRLYKGCLKLTFLMERLQNLALRITEKYPEKIFPETVINKVPYLLIKSRTQ